MSRKYWVPEIVVTCLAAVLLWEFWDQDPDTVPTAFEIEYENFIIGFVILAHLLISFSSLVIANTITYLNEVVERSGTRPMFKTECSLLYLYRVVSIMVALQNVGVLYLLFFSWDYAYVFMLTMTSVMFFIVGVTTIAMRGDVLRLFEEAIRSMRREDDA